MRLLSQYMLRSPFHSLVQPNKYKANSTFYYFSSVIDWNCNTSHSNTKKLKDENNYCIRHIRLIPSRAYSYDASKLRSNNFFHQWKAHRTFGSSSHQYLQWNTKKYFFSTAVTPPPNNENDPSLKTYSSTPGETSKRGEKARELAQKGAKKARKGGSKVKELITKYGRYFGGTYFCIYLVTISSFYGAIDSGLIDPTAITSFWGGELMGDGEEEVDAVKMVAHLLEKWEWTRAYSESVEKNPKLVTLGVAWLGTKIVEPARIATAVFVAPKVAKAFGSRNVEEKVDPSSATDHKKKEGSRK